MPCAGVNMHLLINPKSSYTINWEGEGEKERTRQGESDVIIWFIAFGALCSSK
jgi:hypothetical protein